jgi:hypothetical protein
MQGREEADQELFTRLLNATLDGEALLEANQRNATGLLPSLGRAVQWARSADESRDRVHAEQALQQLRDLRDQVDDKQEALVASGLPPEQATRQRVAGWVWFYEHDLLPHFWDAIREDVRDRAIERLRALRVQLQTGASAQELDSGLTLLRETVCTGELEPALRAWITAGLLGVPDRMSERLRALATRARNSFQAGGAAEHAADMAALHDALAEADKAWKAWHETGFILDARPDLVFVRQDHGRAN